MAAATVVSLRRRKESKLDVIYAKLPSTDEGTNILDETASMLLNGV